MQSVVGIFADSNSASRAVQDLQSRGVANNHINLLFPGASAGELRAVPTDTGERTGMGEAVGAVVGTGLGASGGAYLGMAAASALVPGVGTVVAVGVAAAALLGVAGAVGGAAAGDALEDALSDGLPKDEWFVYGDALRQGRSIVAVQTETDSRAKLTRAILSRNGAADVDTARERWWIGLRSAEEERYRANGDDFKSVEPDFRCGFEAALHPETRGRSYESVVAILRERHPDRYQKNSFREGYERGQDHLRTRQDNGFTG